MIQTHSPWYITAQLKLKKLNKTFFLMICNDLEIRWTQKRNIKQLKTTLKIAKITLRTLICNIMRVKNIRSPL